MTPQSLYAPDYDTHTESLDSQVKVRRDDLRLFERELNQSIESMSQRQFEAYLRILRAVKNA